MKNKCTALCIAVLILSGCAAADESSHDDVKEPDATTVITTEESSAPAETDGTELSVSIEDEEIVTVSEDQTETVNENGIPRFHSDGYDKDKKYATPYGLFCEFEEINKNNEYMLNHPSVVDKELMQRYVCSDPADMQAVLDDMTALGDVITTGKETEYEKARAIAKYVAENIYYDLQVSKETGGLSVMTAEQVLESSHATCIGYANLVSALCYTQGIICLTLMGGSASEGYTRAELREAPVNHTWNAIYCDGRWYFSDATWASGNMFIDGEEISAPQSMDFYLMLDFHEMNIEHRIDSCELDYIDLD
ncbi:MAG: hypothetical protein K6G68_00300 [Oscillospiraceae bacterium]|nr:hypothetical protein [Oscillospiraceae bacterium]